MVKELQLGLAALLLVFLVAKELPHKSNGPTIRFRRMFEKKNKEKKKEKKKAKKKGYAALHAEALRQNHKTGPRGDMNLILLDRSEMNTRNAEGAPAFDAILPAQDPRTCHIIDVLALKVGDCVRVGVVGGMMGDATVKSIGGISKQKPAGRKLTKEPQAGRNKNKVVLRVLDADLCMPPPLPSPVSLVIAMTRPKVFSSQLMSAVSMGVKRIYIIQTARTEPTLWLTHHLRDEDIRVLCLRSLGQARDTIMPIVTKCQDFKKFQFEHLPKIMAHAIPNAAFVAHPCAEGSRSPVLLRSRQRVSGSNAVADASSSSNANNNNNHNTGSGAGAEVCICAADVCVQHSLRSLPLVQPVSHLVEGGGATSSNDTSSSEPSSNSKGDGAARVSISNDSSDSNSNDSSNSSSGSSSSGSSSSGTLQDQIVFIIGSEGGFSHGEILAFRKAGLRMLSLGTRILKSEHAVPVLLGLTMALKKQQE